MASDVSEQLRRQVAERAYHVCEYRLIHEDDTLLRLPGGPHHQPQARRPHGASQPRVGLRALQQQ